MTGEKPDQQFINEVKAVFDHSVEQVDVETVSRLNNIRNTALDAALKGSEPFNTVLRLGQINALLKRAPTPLMWRWIFYPASAFAAASLAIIIFNVVQHDVSTVTIKTEDIEIISAIDGLDFYEDLEFYRWLEDYEIST